MSLTISDVELFSLHYIGLQRHDCNGCSRWRLLPIHWTKMVQICKILLPTTRLLFPLCWRKWKISSSNKAWRNYLSRGKEVKSFTVQIRYHQISKLLGVSFSNYNSWMINGNGQDIYLRLWRPIMVACQAALFVLLLVTQPMMQRQPNCTELRSMDSYIQILCRFQKCI